jgi:type I restriction enzyme M protein
MIDHAMREVEAEDATLKRALPKVFGRESLEKATLSGSIDTFTNYIKLAGTKVDFDLIGRIYEC